MEKNKIIIQYILVLFFFVTYIDAKINNKKVPTSILKIRIPHKKDEMALYHKAKHPLSAD